ncbi:MAG: TolC family protein [Deltaproteobacteria bacterium]|nr:TolC family protein [Deltaproteobacteria bacterium]
MISRKYVYLLLIALVFVPQALFAETLVLSLEKCLEMAGQNSEKIQVKDLGIEGAQWRYQESLAGGKPVFEYKDRIAPVPTDADHPAESFFNGDLTFFNSFRFGVGVPLYASGKLTTAKNLGLKGIEEARMRHRMEKEEVEFEVKQLYFGILLGSEMNYLFKDAVEKINKQLAQEEEEPKHSPYEIAKLKVFKLELAKRMNETGEKIELAKEALRLHLGIQEEHSFRLQEAELLPVTRAVHPLSYYLQGVRQNRPDWQLIDIGVAAKRLQLRLEKQQPLPNVGFGGFFEIGRTTGDIQNLSATDGLNNPFNYTRAGIGIEITGKFDWNSFRSKVKRLRSEVKKATLEESLAKKGIDLEVQKAYEELQRDGKNLALAEERKKLARQMMFLSKSNLEVGVGNEEEYTDALQLVLMSKGEYYKAVFDYNVAFAKLEWKAGEKQQ